MRLDSRGITIVPPFDPVLLARPAWWKATIWIDAVLFGPFYALAIYAYARGKDWIRLPSVIWASVMLTNVTTSSTRKPLARLPHLSSRWCCWPIWVG